MNLRSQLLAALVLVFASLPLGLAQPTDRAVWLVPIETQITPATARYVESRVARANEEMPLALLFLIDTPGGRVDAMEDIVDAILNQARVPTIAVVENAFSAGALIAMSAGQLAMLPGSSIGAALTVQLDPLAPTGLTAADEKINSANESRFRSVAQARGRNADVAGAMVDPKVEIPGLDTASELVTLSAAGAVEYGIADYEASSLQDALEHFGYAGAPIERLEPTLTERVAIALTGPLVAALLLAVGIGGIVIELFTPGFGVPGAIGVVSLALFLGSSFIATPAGAVDILILMVGLTLIALEIFVFPGTGVAGVLGLFAIGFAVFRIFDDDWTQVVGYAALFGCALVALALWMLPNARFAGGLRLSTRLVNEPTVTPAWSEGLYRLTGQRGVSLTDLRPAGIARFGDTRVDVVTEGDYVSRDSAVEVLRVEGSRVTVREVRDDS